MNKSHLEKFKFSKSHRGTAEARSEISAQVSSTLGFPIVTKSPVPVGVNALQENLSPQIHNDVIDEQFAVRISKCTEAF